MKWYCKYCDKELKTKSKKYHILTNLHKSKARWYKYFREIDRCIKPIYEEYKNGMISVDKFNEMEQDIYSEFDTLDDQDHFKNLPYSDDEQSV